MDIYLVEVVEDEALVAFEFDDVVFVLELKKDDLWRLISVSDSALVKLRESKE